MDEDYLSRRPSLFSAFETNNAEQAEEYELSWRETYLNDLIKQITTTHTDRHQADQKRQEIISEWSDQLQTVASEQNDQDMAKKHAQGRVLAIVSSVLLALDGDLSDGASSVTDLSIASLLQQHINRHFQMRSRLKFLAGRMARTEREWQNSLQMGNQYAQNLVQMRSDNAQLQVQLERQRQLTCQLSTNLNSLQQSTVMSEFDWCMDLLIQQYQSGCEWSREREIVRLNYKVHDYISSNDDRDGIYPDPVQKMAMLTKILEEQVRSELERYGLSLEIS